jgi:hypothetical protein
VETEPNISIVTPDDTPLHLHADGRPKMLHEATTPEERIAIINTTSRTAIRRAANEASGVVQEDTARALGERAVETLTTEVL